MGLKDNCRYEPLEELCAVWYSLSFELCASLCVQGTFGPLTTTQGAQPCTKLSWQNMYPTGECLPLLTWDAKEDNPAWLSHSHKKKWRWQTKEFLGRAQAAIKTA